MNSSFSAEQAVRRIQEHFGTAWKNSGIDGFKEGNPKTPVTGIATTWTPTVEVLRQAAAKGQNLVVSVQAPFWSGSQRPGGSGRNAAPPRPSPFTVPPVDIETTELYRYKSHYIDEHNLVIWRFSENWDALPEQFRLHALAAALGWQGHQDLEATKTVAQVNAAVYALPKTSVLEMANQIKSRIGVRAMRVLGDPHSMISRVVLRPGYLLVPDMMQMVRATKADAVACGEPCEWEAFEYGEDWISAGWGKAMFMLGYAVSEDPGTKEMASWIKSLIPEVPVSHIPSGEPFRPAKAQPPRGDVS